MGITSKSTKFDKKFELLLKNVQSNNYMCENCKCKRVIRFDRDRTLCPFCGHYIYKSEELKKKYEFKEELLKKIQGKNKEIDKQ